ncbi:MAG TPA: hypothetical protein VHU42_07480 [Rhodopila sp.]|jgi:Zn-dependent alcohol dehydrogenase|nr:hypothetical protein [Rhodopila sp.]
MPLSFRAAVLPGAGEILRAARFEAEYKLVGTILARIGAGGLYHTDLDVTGGHLVYPMPIVPGHAAAGTIGGDSP